MALLLLGLDLVPATPHFGDNEIVNICISKIYTVPDRKLVPAAYFGIEGSGLKSSSF